MATAPANQSRPRESLALQRFLAVILFSLAAIVGVPMALVLVVALLQADLRVLPVVATFAPITWAVGWLGTILWSGRSIPRWFLLAFGLLIFAVPVATVGASGNWTQLATILSMLLPISLPFWTARPGQPAKPTKVAFDELA